MKRKYEEWFWSSYVSEETGEYVENIRELVSAVFSTLVHYRFLDLKWRRYA